jgi:hypothetical protein
MGYRALFAAVFRAAGLVRGHAPRVALVFCFAAASVLSVMTPAFAAASAPPEAAVSNDHHAHGDAHAKHSAPCDHGQDCDCHGTAAPAPCCSSNAAAAIWTTAEPLPSFEAARCMHAAGKLAVRAAVDPPTPPPRSALS